MPNPLRSSWRWLFPRLQRALPSHHGHPLLLNLDRAAQVFHQLYENGHYDPSTNGEAWLLQALSARQPAVILDVGANVGDYARLALAHCPSADVYCLEPMPAVFAQLEAELADEPRVHLHQQALTAENGTCTFYFDPRATGNTTALADVQAGVHGLREVERINARTQTLDSFCEEHDIGHINLLKIDVEGFESSVLKGGAGMIASGSIDCIQLEYGKANLFSRTFVHDYMREYGASYLIGKLYPRGVKWFGCYSADLDDLLGPNLVMIQRKHGDLAQSLSMLASAHLH